MKKIGVLFAVLLLSLTLVSAIETNLKQEYKPGETFIMEISGNFIEPVKPENILFYSSRLYVPMLYDITNIDNKYYIYALLPLKERNYTLIIKNARYIEQAQEKNQNLEFNFDVKGNISAFQVNPGFIVANKDFSIQVLAYKNLDIKAEFLNSTQQASIIDGQTRKFIFPVSGITNSNLNYLAVSSPETEYKIPVLIFQNKSVSIKKYSEIRFSESSLNFTVLKGEKFEFEVSIMNLGQESIADVYLSSSSDAVKVYPEKTSLQTAELKKINLTIDSDTAGSVNGTLKANTTDYSAEIPINVIIFDNQQEFQEAANNTLITEESCSGLGGRTCKNETCQGTNKLSFEGLCCIGTCGKKSSSSLGTIIAVIIIIMLLGTIGFFVFKKIKAKKSSSRELLENKTKQFEERFQPRESRGNLTRV